MDKDPLSELSRIRKKLGQRIDERVQGGSPVQKQIILLKLTDLYENRPEKFGEYGISAGSPEREWLSAVGALIKKHDPIFYGTSFDMHMRSLNSLGTAFEILGLVGDVIEAIKLDLELDGRSEIGTVYKAGEVYRLYADLKDIIGKATESIFAIDAYLTGKAFDDYFGASRDITLLLLTTKFTDDLTRYAERHSQQNNTTITIRKSKEIHDRLLIVDGGDTWVLGGSLNQKGDKPTYLLPLSPGIAENTRDVYSGVWDKATPVELSSTRNP